MEEILIKSLNKIANDLAWESQTRQIDNYSVKSIISSSFRRLADEIEKNLEKKSKLEYQNDAQNLEETFGSHGQG